MSRALLVLHSDEIRARAIDWIRRLPKETRVEFKGPKRTLPQNDRLHAMITDIAGQLEWVGQRRSVIVWKKLLLDLFDHERGTDPQLIPALHGEGFVRLDGHTSDLSTQEGAEFIEFLFSFGAENGIVWSDPKERAA